MTDRKSLIQLINNNLTDKESIHSYVPVYEHKLGPRRDTVKRVLEVGIERGGSLLLWRDYFPKAEVWGFDIQDHLPACLKDQQRIKVFKANAYQKEIVTDLIQKGLYFDVIVDDGPHTLESMCFFAKYYSQLLAPGGVLCIEDIPNPDWLDAISGCVPTHLRPFMEAYDLRTNKGRFDDIMFFINHQQTPQMPPGLLGATLPLRR